MACSLIMRRAFFVILVLLIGVIPLQTSAQVSVPAVELICINQIDEMSVGPNSPMAEIDASPTNNNTTIFEPISCTVSNPNSYSERIQIQIDSNGLSVDESAGTISLGPNANESFNISLSGELGMAPDIRIINITATVVEANGAPPPSVAKSHAEGEIWISNDEWIEPEVMRPCYSNFTEEMIHQANNWRFVLMGLQYTNNSGIMINSTVKIQLNHTAAPLHSENFALLALAGCYDDSIFHRVIDNFIIQSGDVEYGNGQGGYTAKWYGYCNGYNQDSEGEVYTSEDCNFEQWSIPGEHQNGLKHRPGVVAAANAGLNTDGSQFYILPSDSNPTHLDWSEGKDCLTSSCHTIFGMVVEGQEHIDAISEIPTSGSDKPTNDATIIHVTLWNGTDTDDDGIPDDLDDFPNNPEENLDSDDDGVGDNSDAFPDDANETTDSDGDGVGDNSDVFPNDANETHDDDGDGVGNNSDEFPQDPTEQYDDDQDGVGNNADDFPNNALMSNWATVYATVGILLVLLIAAGVTISRMKKQEELPNVAADSDLQKLQNEIDELEKKKAELIGLQDPTAELFED